MDDLWEYNPLEEMSDPTHQEKLGRLALFPDQHLDVPIRGCVYDWLEYYEANESHKPKLQSYKKKRVERMYDQIHDSNFHDMFNPHSYAIPVVNDPATAFGDIFVNLPLNTWEVSSADQLMDEEHRISSLTSWNLFCESEKALGITRTATLGPNIVLESSTPLIRKYRYLMNFLRSCVLMMNNIISTLVLSRDLPYVYKIIEGSVYLRSNDNISACTKGEGAALFYQGQIYNLSKEALLCLSDLSHQKYNILITSQWTQSLNLSQYPDLGVITKIFNWGDKILQETDGYKLVKMFEQVCTLVLIEKKTEKVCDNREFWNGALQDLDEIADKDMIDNVIAFKGFLETLPIDHVSQILGLFRIWGHPVVNTLMGVAKVKASALKTQVRDGKLANDINRMFKILFIKGYIKKHQRWPKVTITKLAINYVRYQHKMSLVLDLYSPNFKLEDADQIELEQTFFPDPTFNISTLMADKALPLNKDQLVYNLKRNGGIGKSESRRLLLRWLQSNIVSVKDLIQSVDNVGFWPNELCVGVTDKEREIGQVPRLFALLPLEPRLYFVITEHLLADHILDYFPQITMGSSDIELSKKLHNITKQQRPQDPNSLNFQEYNTLNIDFEKWNLMMRQDVSLPLFDSFDKLLGYGNVYKRTHKYFYNSKIYVANEEAKIEVANGDLEEGPYCCSGHTGGFEGQRQKGWTILTVCMIMLCMVKARLSHQLVGQGDNQVLVILSKIPRHIINGEMQLNYAAAKRKFGDFKQRFYAICEEAGLPVKQFETWESSVVFQYGKQFFYHRNPLPLSEKRSCRQFPLANNDFPSLSSEISTIFGSGNSATQQDLCHTIAFLSSLYQASLCIQKNLSYSVLISKGLSHFGDTHRDIIWKTDSGSKIKFKNQYSLANPNKLENFLIFMLLYPRILGGLPIQLLPSSLLRGFPDPRMESLSFMKALNKSTKDPFIKRVTHYLFNTKTRSSPRSS